MASTSRFRFFNHETLLRFVDFLVTEGKTYTLPAVDAALAPLASPAFTGTVTKAQAAPAAKTVTAGLSAADLVGGLITTTGATGPSVHQLPTGTELDAALPAAVVNDSFDFTIINTGTGASNDATITVNTDVTIVGNPTVGALTDATIISGSGTFRARRTAAHVWVVYRLA